MTRWVNWKQGNWWEPLVALPLILIVVLFYAMIWLPYGAIAYLWKRSAPSVLTALAVVGRFAMMALLVLGYFVVMSLELLRR